MKPNTLKKLVWWAAACYWVALFVLTHIPQGQGPEVGSADKLAHFIAYGLLSALLFVSLWIRRPQSWGLLWQIPLIVLAYGAVDEWLQAMPFVNRSCELADWYADAIGMGIVVVPLGVVKWWAGRKSVTRIEAEAPEQVGV